ncbi:MAG: SMP-30/gluconolactonase/LRE family protein [Acidobacteria bacterium]|nr:SMP-30/gluconolactonase/LRE family protein [Acidobacteriota bacterium]
MPTRRLFLATAGALAAQQQTPISPDPADRDWTGAKPIKYPDPDVIALTPAFRKYMIGNTSMKKLHTGTSWAEGPAWNGVGKYMVWSDIPANVQLRFVDDDARVTVFRNPAGYSNGNTFDYEGRQLSCEHGGRRVVRYEYNGTTTTIADKFEGKRLNSPNDIVVHPDGSIWFTDPPYGIGGNYEGYQAPKELKEAVYRADPKTGRVEKLTEDVSAPNGICFSPDYKKMYIADTGAQGRDLKVWDIDGTKVRNGKQLVQMKAPTTGAVTAFDGIRCDTDGNIWGGARPGVMIVSPAGEQIGMIRLPENCANVCFGGLRRNRLFMTASQGLYALYVNATGAHIA